MPLKRRTIRESSSPYGKSHAVAPEDYIRVSRSASIKIAFSRALTTFGITLILAVLAYGVIASTLVRIVPTTSGAGWVMTKNITVEGGADGLRSGDQVLVSTKVYGDGIFDHLSQAVIPPENASIFQIVTGPYSTVEWKAPGNILVDGKITAAKMTGEKGKSPLPGNVKRYTLRGEYVGICVKGACESGESYIFAKNRVVGMTAQKHDLNASIIPEIETK